MDAGAYFIPNQMNFSNPRPPAVMLNRGEASLIRSRESFEDVVRLDRVAAGGAAASAHDRAVEPAAARVQRARG